MNNTFFAQAERMDVRLGGGVNVPAAAISAFNGIGIIILIPAVNRVIYPFFDRIGYQLSQLKKMGEIVHCMYRILSLSGLSIIKTV